MPKSKKLSKDSEHKIWLLSKKDYKRMKNSKGVHDSLDKQFGSSGYRPNHAGGNYKK